jgi:phenylalanyl-tRNA synthetase beta chain
MHSSLSWLSSHVDFSAYSMSQLDDLLTFAGIEVEGMRSVADAVVIAKIVSSDKHPDAEKLSVCQVDDGSGKPRQIVCGAKNYKVGDLVPLALPGAVLDLGGGKTMTISEGKLRGVESLGMLCSAKELGLSESSDGLLILDGKLKPGTPLNEVYPAVFELEITPNRPDCLSHLGVARELAALAGKPLLGVTHYRDSKTKTRAAKASEIRISASDACPYYTARTIRGIKVGPSPAWLIDRLQSVGLRPINNVVDVTNYVLMEMGQPLHAFDLAKINGGIEVRHAVNEESFVALNEVTYTLTSDDLVIADAKKALALGGVMGGADSGVSESTTDILVEAAFFTTAGIRRTGRRHGLHSDSSYRFERGVDAHQTLGACDLAVKLILELAGGQADPEILIAGELPALPTPVALDPDYCRGVIGADLSDDVICGILTSLGLVAGKQGWIIPSYRRDLERPIDLVEEVARVHGLDQVPSRVQAWFSPGSKADEMYDFQRRLQSRLAALGFFEARNLKLISATQLADDLTTTHRGMSPVRLKNPLNDEQDYLRPGLLPGLLASAARNRRFGRSDLRFFEMGRVFTASPKGDEIEHEHLAFLMTGGRRPRSWAEVKPDPLDLADLRAVLEAICPEGLQFVPVEDPRLLGAVSIEVGLGKKAQKLGLAGIVPPARARELDFAATLLVAELNLKKLASLVTGDATFADLPKFPGSGRDVAMLVPATLRAGEVASVFANHEEALLRSAELFDVFTDPSGQKLPADRKSLAYSLHYRADDRTLSAAEVEAAHGKVLDGLKKALPVEFR